MIRAGPSRYEQNAPDPYFLQQKTVYQKHKQNGRSAARFIPAHDLPFIYQVIVLIQIWHTSRDERY